MQPSDQTRRLAAVWFADIVGYTSLSSRDEDAAMRIVTDFQDHARTTAEAHGGRVVKLIGDAILTEFDSVDGALRSALDVLAAFEEHPAVKANAVALRVGLHTGEVVGADDGDIYGDGVNFASRLETAAAPGRVFVSDAVHAQVRQRPVFETRSVGQRLLKGLPGAIEVYEAAYAGKLKAPLPKQTLSTRPTHMRRSRAIALGFSVAMVSFLSLIVWNAAKAGSGALDFSFETEQLTYTGTAESPRFSQNGETVAILEEAGVFGGSMRLCETNAATAGCAEGADGVQAFDWVGADSLVWTRSGAVFAGTGDGEGARVASGWGTLAVGDGAGFATHVEHGRSGSRIVRHSLDGSSADTVLVTPPGTRVWEAAWSPSGQRLLVTYTDEEGAASLRLYPEGPAEPIVLLRERVVQPRWAPDERAIFFLRDLGRARSLFAMRVDSDGQPAAADQRVPIGRNVEDYDIGPSGEIAYTEVQRQSNLVEVALAAGSSEPLTRGTARISSPALDASGERLAFVRNGDVYLSAGTAEASDAQLTELAAPIAALRWSPDGKYLAFIVQEESQRRLHVVDADPSADSESRQVPLEQSLPYDLDPELVWAEDGDAVVYVAADDAGWPSILSKVDVFSERDQLLVSPDSQSAESLQGLVASPDGSRVVLADGFGGLRYLSAGGGEPIDVYLDVPGLPVHWSPDGRIVIRSILDRTELRVVDVEGSTTRPLSRLPDECDQVAVSLAGGRAVCAIPAPAERDVWIARPSR